ncbi:MAG: hypothetical protein PHF21_04945, partial [Bacilli bacterium]|nr:hypothetical protein [Bacilli bacterium]
EVINIFNKVKVMSITEKIPISDKNKYVIGITKRMLGIDNISEMAHISGKLMANSYSREPEWNMYYKGKHKPILERIGSSHYKLYKIMSNYFLTTEDDNYLGYIELENKNGKHLISSSSTLLERGFYNIMFTCILSLNINEILSDTNLSTNAVNAYNRLFVNDYLLIRIYDPIDNKYLPFSKEILASHGSYRVSVMEKEKGSIKEHLEEYYNRIDKFDDEAKTIWSSYNKMYSIYHNCIDNYLFCENFDDN